MCTSDTIIVPREEKERCRHLILATMNKSSDVHIWDHQLGQQTLPADLVTVSQGLRQENEAFLHRKQQ